MKKIERKVHKIDAEGQVLGRLATQIASILRGKHKPEFQAHIDGGDVVEVINVDKIKITGKKLEQKKYFSHSGYPGGLKEKKMGDVFESNPGEVLRRAVKKMISSTKLRNDMMKRLIIR
jgi:large subunit ribosomal protein L13